MANDILLEKNVADNRKFCNHTLRIPYSQAPFSKADFTARLYSEYFSHGDLQSILDIYWSETHRHRQIPEPFIWYVFKSISCAIYALTTGRCALSPGKKRKRNADTAQDELSPKPEPRWDSYVHLDIKPSNIFLARPVEPHTAYPLPTLADYDLTNIAGKKLDQDNQRTKKGIDTNRAPEMECTHLHAHPVTSKVDIWSLGMVIWSLMHTSLGFEKAEEVRTQNITANFHFDEGAAVPNRKVPKCTAMYSRELHKLVEQCLEIDPAKRVGVVELIK